MIRVEQHILTQNQENIEDQLFYDENNKSFADNDDIFNFYLDRSHYFGTDPNINYNKLSLDNGTETFIFQRNIRVEGIPETYNTEVNNNAINKEGTLCVIINEIDPSNPDRNIKKVEIFDVFNNYTDSGFADNGISQENIPYQYTGNNKNYHPALESTHRLVLKKNTDNYYYAVPLFIGNKSTKYLYSIDLPEIYLDESNILTPESNGFFESNALIEKISTFVFSFKPYFYIKSSSNVFVEIENFDSTSGNNILTIDNTNGGIYIIDKNNIIEDNENTNTIKLKIYGDESSADTILFEIR